MIVDHPRVLHEIQSLTWCHRAKSGRLHLSAEAPRERRDRWSICPTRPIARDRLIPHTLPQMRRGSGLNAKAPPDPRIDHQVGQGATFEPSAQPRQHLIDLGLPPPRKTLGNQAVHPAPHIRPSCQHRLGGTSPENHGQSERFEHRGRAPARDAPALVVKRRQGCAGRGAETDFAGGDGRARITEGHPNKLSQNFAEIHV